MKKLLSLVIVGLMAIGCAKWVSIDITNETITLVSPQDNQADSIQEKTFTWLELEGANKYQIQIVSPRFDSILTYVLDSNVSITVFEANLTPGDYQWRVRGVNDDFQSKWSVRDLIIKSSASLENQTIGNVKPIDGTNTNSMTQNFTWNELVSAEYYSIVIKDEEDNEIEVSNSDEPSFDYVFPTEGFFTINIKALNDISASITNSVNIRIDTTAPSSVTLDYPLYDTLKSFPQNFEWTEVLTNEGSEISTNLLIASDSLMTALFLDTTISSLGSIELDSVETSGKLFWRVDRTDAAGNSTTGVSKGFWIK